MGGGASKAKKPEENYKAEEKNKNDDRNDPDVANVNAANTVTDVVALPAESGSSEKLMNSAFVFIKPHANNPDTQKLIASTLQSRGIQIVREGEFSGPQIDEDMLIDRHYYAIASKATLMQAKDIPVPKEKFQAVYNVSWDDVLASNRAFNAVEAQKELGVDIAGLNALWLNTPLQKFGGGFYCGEIPHTDSSKPSIFTFNAFFMTMRGKFVAPSASIHYYVVKFDPAVLSWGTFRSSVLGPTDCSKAPADSLRGKLFAEWQQFGLSAEPNVSDNCVHASASPLEGLGERLNWLKVNLADDEFGRAVLAAGISEDTVKTWTLDAQVHGKSIFDQLEDKNAQDCLDTMIKLNANPE